MKHASAYLRKGQILLSPFSKTTKGFMVRWEPVVVTGEDDPELGRKVLWILSRSIENVPHPDSWVGRSNALAKAAGVRSYEAFADLARCVGIGQDDQGVVFTPTRNGGRGNRFLGLKTEIRCRPDDKDVAQALRQAFEACE